MACALYDSATGCRFPAHEHGDADNTFVADHGNFGRGTVFHDIQQRHDGGGWKIDIRHAITRFVQHMSERHLDVFQIGTPRLQQL